MNTKTLFLLVVICLSNFSACAFPNAAPGTEGFSVTVSGSEPVIATCQGNSPFFSDDLCLDSNLISVITVRGDFVVSGTSEATGWILNEAVEKAKDTAEGAVSGG